MTLVLMGGSAVQGVVPPVGSHGRPSCLLMPTEQRTADRQAIHATQGRGVNSSEEARASRDCVLSFSVVMMRVGRQAIRAASCV